MSTSMYRSFCIFTALFTLILLAFGFYLENVEGLKPCPLCLLQRIVYALIGVLFIIAAIQKPKSLGKSIYSLLIFIVSGIGIALAWRQIYLEQIPASARPACTPSLDFLLTNLPPTKVLSTILIGSGECGEVLWRFWGMSLGEWSLLAFIALMILGIVSAFLKTAKRE